MLGRKKKCILKTYESINLVRLYIYLFPSCIKNVLKSIERRSSVKQLQVCIMGCDVRGGRHFSHKLFCTINVLKLICFNSLFY